MDQFSFRKGRTYGTLLVDVEAVRVVDVLPDLTSETFAAWLREHPGAEIICRDRTTAYTRAIKEAAPDTTCGSPARTSPGPVTLPGPSLNSSATGAASC
ncbi:transposase [Streptomyces sp. NPDC058746]|uniref:transposase n=1 Tax=Streptomyces sp. NPDC058746 TaxID=3346622 RepID=UPI0036A1FEEE